RQGPRGVRHRAPHPRGHPRDARAGPSRRPRGPQSRARPRRAGPRLRPHPARRLALGRGARALPRLRGLARIDRDGTSLLTRVNGMTAADPRVAIYIDFDNVVVSRAGQVAGTGVASTVAIDVLLDFATRYGRLTI